MSADVYYEKDFVFTGAGEQALNKRWRFHEFYVTSAVGVVLTMPNGQDRPSEAMDATDGYLYEGALTKFAVDGACTVTWIGRV
jgi:hypothetical protein